jgi:hypothetical protein
MVWVPVPISVANEGIGGEFCEHDNEPSYFMNCGELLDHTSDH